MILKKLNGKTGEYEKIASFGDDSSDELLNAVQNALAEAKKSGAFDGKNGADGEDGSDGVSPTVTVSAITGGHRITITDASGTKSIDVLNGSNGKDGSAGKDGSNGADGKDGADGVGIASIVQTTTSTADDGNNVITITLTNGEKVTFTVQNGSKGSKGDAGEDGKDGKDGKDGSDATVTDASIKTALGYTPAKQEDLDGLSEEKVDQSGWTANKFLGTDASGKIVAKEAPQGGVTSVNGKTGAVNLVGEDITYTLIDDVAGESVELNMGETLSNLQMLALALLEPTYAEALDITICAPFGGDITGDITNATVNLEGTTDPVPLLPYLTTILTLQGERIDTKLGENDVVNKLTSSETTKPLSANQGKVLKGLIDALQTAVDNIAVPTKTSQLSNDSNYVSKNQLTLAYGTDGKLYLNVGGEPIGNGIEIGVSGDVVGVVDANNNIVLSGNLADGKYTLKYENEDGTVTEVGSFDVGEILAYTNLFNPSTATLNKGFSSTSASTGYLKDRTGHVFSDYIPFPNGALTIPLIENKNTDHIIRIKNAQWAEKATIAYCKQDGSFVMGEFDGYVYYEHYAGEGADANGDMQLALCSKYASGTAHGFRIALYKQSTAVTAEDIKDIIVTFDEPIVD